MKNNQINRVISLVRKTGDRVVVMDQETEDVLVMMRLDEYENLMEFALPGGDNGPLPDFENWEDEEAGIGDESAVPTLDDEDASFERQTSQPEQSKASEKTPKLEFNEDWEKTTMSASLEEDLSDVAEDEGEPRFYLEPVE